MNYLSIIKKIPIIVMTLSLVACGGAAESDPESSSNSSSNSNGNPSSSNGETNTNTTPGIFEIAKDFNLSGVENVEVSVDVESDPDEKSYLSICHMKQDESFPSIDYENCIVRSQVVGGEFSGQFKRPPHVMQLAFALWFFDTSKDPVLSHIDSADLESGQISLN